MELSAFGPPWPGLPYSPKTALAGDIAETDTSFEVVDGGALPPGPNIAVIGDGETVLYDTLAGALLIGVQRGVEGPAQAWPAGAQVARNFTNLDFQHVRARLLADMEDISALSTHYSDTVAPALTGLAASISSINGQVDGLKETKANAANVYAKSEVDTIVSDATLATQTWLPAVALVADLPVSVPAPGVNYLCRVMKGESGVYQHIAADTTAANWSYFSDNLDFVDETELDDALAAARAFTLAGNTYHWNFSVNAAGNLVFHYELEG